MGLIDEIAHAIDPTRMLFEAPRKDQQVWFLRRFGPEVNLGNIAPDDVLSLETLRLGPALRHRRGRRAGERRRDPARPPRRDRRQPRPIRFQGSATRPAQRHRARAGARAGASAPRRHAGRRAVRAAARPRARDGGDRRRARIGLEPSARRRAWPRADARRLEGPLFGGHRARGARGWAASGARRRGLPLPRRRVAAPSSRSAWRAALADIAPGRRLPALVVCHARLDPVSRSRALTAAAWTPSTSGQSRTRERQFRL